MRRAPKSRRAVWAIAGLCALTLGVEAAKAQIDISGEWGSRLHEDLNQRFDGPMPGDFAGIPLNAAGRQKASSWDASILAAPEEQTKPHPVQYGMWGPGTNLRITKIFEPFNDTLIGYRIAGLYGRADRTIWLDGRAHPSAHAEHLWQGFSTGVIEDDKLVVSTTHLKAGMIGRNGPFVSYKAKLTEYFIRHDNMLVLTSIVEDPIYLEEPFIRTMAWVVTPDLGVDNRMRSEAVEEVAGRAKDFVPAYPLGTVHDDFAKAFGLPVAATQGGAAATYPEYKATLAALLKGQKPPPGPAPVPPPPPPSRTGKAADGVEVLQLRSNLHMLVVEGVNVTVQTGDDGVLIVDAGPATGSDALLTAVRALSKGAIRYLINTSFYADSTGANAAVVATGGERIIAGSSSTVPKPAAAGVAVIAHEKVAAHLAEAGAELPPEAYPTSTFYRDHKDLHFNGEAIEMRAGAAARSDSDIIVFFRGSDVVSVGGLLDTTRFPMIDRAAGGSLEGLIKVLGDVLEITVPERNQIGGTLVVPGVGRICNEADIDEYRNMLIIIRDRIKAMAARKMSLAQVRAAQPLLDYDGVYGAKDGPWTSDMFLEAVYDEYKTPAGRKP